MKKSFRIILSVILSLVMVVSAGSTRTAADNDRKGPIIVVSLGDSYSSGEGIPPFYGENKPNRELDINWLAHRSTQSWPSMIVIPTGLVDKNGKEITSKPMSKYFVDVYSNDGVTNRDPDYEWYFVAASGAETKDYRGEQTAVLKRYGTYKPQSWVFSQIHGTVDYVTLTLGGNDVHFSEVIYACATGSSYFDFNWFKKTLLDWIGGIISELDKYEDNIRKTYKEIGEDAPEAYIIVAGYPTLLNADGCLPFIEKNEAELINMATKLFNLSIRVICAQLGDRYRFVDVQEKFSGHEAFTEKNWINPIYIGPQKQDINPFTIASRHSVHPNEAGARVYADLVNAEIARIEKEKRLANGIEMSAPTPAPTSAATLAPTPVPTSKPTPTPTPTPASPTDTLPDGDYYGLLTSWTRNTMSVELLNYAGRYEMSYNYILNPTGQYMTLDISKATVLLEYAWSEDHVDTQYSSIDAALNTKVWEGETVRDCCTMEIRFTMRDSKVTKIMFLYAA